MSYEVPARVFRLQALAETRLRPILVHPEVSLRSKMHAPCVTTFGAAIVARRVTIDSGVDTVGWGDDQRGAGGLSP